MDRVVAELAHRSRHQRAPFRREPYRWREEAPTLEDVFIHLMAGAEDNFR